MCELNANEVGSYWLVLVWKCRVNAVTEVRILYHQFLLLHATYIDYHQSFFRFIFPQKDANNSLGCSSISKGVCSPCHLFIFNMII